MKKWKKSRLLIMMFLLCTIFLMSSCEQEPTWQALYDAGIQCTEEKDYEQAIASFEEAIALDANKPEAYSALADVYVAMENLEKALEVLQQGVEATGDDSLKARVEELAAKLEELAGPQKPEYMVDYLGMTVNEIAALWGEDYTVSPDLYFGGSKGIYYDDNRIAATFYFQDASNLGVQTGEEQINLIQISTDLNIAEGFSAALTHPELEKEHPEGEFVFFEESGYNATYTCQYRDDISIIYEWTYGVDPETTPSSWVSLFMEGMDTQDSQSTQASTSPSTQVPSWKELYKAELLQSLNTGIDPSMCKYYVYDIDGNGTPELFEGIGTCRADYTTYVYTVRDGSLVRLGEIFGDQIGALDEQSVFGYYAQMGYETVAVYSLVNDSIAEVSQHVKESPESYTNFSFIPSFSLDDLSGLNWTANSSSGNNQNLVDSFSNM